MTLWEPAGSETDLGGGRRTRAVRHLPEPSKFWIAYSPRSWRCASEPFTDLATGRLGAAHGAKEIPTFDVKDVDDLLYLPPVGKKLRKPREKLAEALVKATCPVLVQRSPGDPPGRSTRDVYDLLSPLLSQDVERLALVPKGATAVWPLIAGVTDHPELWDEGCSLLAEAGAECVQPVLLELSAVERRRLAEGRGDDVFDALFHGPEPSERAFSRYADRHQLKIFMVRRPLGGQPRVLNNRRLAADLALAGELWMRLGRSMSGGQALLRASRGAESTHQDLVALAREKNLRVMNWLDLKSMEMVRDLVLEGSSELLESLLDEYLGREADAEPTP